MVIYTMRVTALGPEVAEFLAKERLIVTFEEGAPPELAEISALHTHGALTSPIQVGDAVLIDESRFQVTAVGSVANKNLEGLGHVIIRFDGAVTPAMAGSIHLLGGELPVIKVGSRIRFLRE